MKKYSNETIIGGLWGIFSSLLYLLFPETFNIYWSGGQSGLIPDAVVIILLLPMYIVVWMWNIVFTMSNDPWAIIYIAPIFVVVSMTVGGLIGYIVKKVKS